MQANPDCLFCKIAARQIPSEVIFEDDHVFAFLDVQPRTTGHAMVIPKYHAPRITELPDEEVGPLFLAVKHMAELLMKKLGCDGITIGANQGRASGQEVDHLHVHLMPRWHGDGGGPIQRVVANPPKESLADIRKKLLEG
ncbi:MAG TPA: HIT family protein [Candidatus Paceibacterota bacterium]|nr:HIT family protein [Candidatus Paceibacterota bacterium]